MGGRLCLFAISWYAREIWPLFTKTWNVNLIWGRWGRGEGILLTEVNCEHRGSNPVTFHTLLLPSISNDEWMNRNMNSGWAIHRYLIDIVRWHQIYSLKCWTSLYRYMAQSVNFFPGFKGCITVKWFIVSESTYQTVLAVLLCASTPLVIIGLGCHITEDYLSKILLCIQKYTKIGFTMWWFYIDKTRCIEYPEIMLYREITLLTY